MPTKKKTAKRKKPAKPSTGQLEQLHGTIKGLRVRLEREARARKLEARVKSQAQRARTQLASQISALREQGRKLASQLRSALGDAGKRDVARQQALAKIAEVKADYAKKSAKMKSELARTTAELKRKSEELKKLAAETAHRAVGIVRGEEPHAAPDAPAAVSSEPQPESAIAGHPDGQHEKESDEEQ
jgi:transposase